MTCYVGRTEWCRLVARRVGSRHPNRTSRKTADQMVGGFESLRGRRTETPRDLRRHRPGLRLLDHQQRGPGPQTDPKRVLHWEPLTPIAQRAITSRVTSPPVVRAPGHPHWWHDCGMSRTRLSTTVDADLLGSARRASGKSDSAMVDEALAALLARHRAAEVDARYAAYDEHPLDEPDEWGDLASFRRAVAAS